MDKFSLPSIVEILNRIEVSKDDGRKARSPYTSRLMRAVIDVLWTTIIYKMDSGDVCLLDRAVWHQALPVTSGVKWCIVIFYKAYRSKAAALAAKSARPESLSLLAVTDE